MRKSKPFAQLHLRRCQASPCVAVDACWIAHPTFFYVCILGAGPTWFLVVSFSAHFHFFPYFFYLSPTIPTYCPLVDRSQKFQQSQPKQPVGDRLFHIVRIFCGLLNFRPAPTHFANLVTLFGQPASLFGSFHSHAIFPSCCKQFLFSKSCNLSSFSLFFEFYTTLSLHRPLFHSQSPTRASFASLGLFYYVH